MSEHSKTAIVRHPLWRGCFKLVVFILCTSILASCSHIKQQPATSDSTHAVAKKPVPDKQGSLVPVNVLLSADIPAYQEIVDALTEKFGAGNIYTYTLNDSGDPLLSIQQSSYRHVVAIGQPAALAVSFLENKRIVYCQVFNHQNPVLVDSRMRGVSMLPPLTAQLGVWKKVSPQLKRVGIITGPNMQHLAADIRREANKQGVRIIHKTVNSDKEFLYVFKRLVPEIDGLWLLPDKRILSRRVMRNVLSYSVKHKVQVMAFSPQLLKSGALLSTTSIAADIAAQIGKIFEENNFRRIQNNVLPLSELELHINLQLAEELGLSVPHASHDFSYTAWPEKTGRVIP